MVFCGICSEFHDVSLNTSTLSVISSNFGIVLELHGVGMHSKYVSFDFNFDPLSLRGRSRREALPRRGTGGERRRAASGSCLPEERGAERRQHRLRAKTALMSG